MNITDKGLIQLLNSIDKHQVDSYDFKQFHVDSYALKSINNEVIGLDVSVTDKLTGNNLLSFTVDQRLGGKLDLLSVSKELNFKKAEIVHCFLNSDIQFTNWEKVLYTPNNYDELKELCDDLDVELGVIDTSRITDMSHLFHDSKRNNYQLHGIELWDVSNVTKMDWMFANCEDFNLDISHWDVSKVTTTEEMFYNCKQFNQYLNDWNVSNVKEMSGMFEGCEEFNSRLDNWDVSNCENLTATFSGCHKFNQPLNNWNVSKVWSLLSTFNECVKFNQPLDNWNVESVERIDGIFAFAINFNQDLSSWNLKKCTSTYNAFLECEIDVDKLPNFKIDEINKTSKPRAEKGHLKRHREKIDKINLEIDEENSKSR